MGKQLGCQCLAGRNKTCFAVCLCREYSGPRGRWTFRQAALSQLLDVSKVHIIIIITLTFTLVSAMGEFSVFFVLLQEKLKKHLQLLGF